MRMPQYKSDEEYIQAVLRARAMSPEEKFLAGERLFNEECEQMKVEIRKEMPEFCEEMVDCELRSRLDLQREGEERGIYITMPIGWVPPK